MLFVFTRTTNSPARFDEIKELNHKQQIENNRIGKFAKQLISENNQSQTIIGELRGEIESLRKRIETDTRTVGELQSEISQSRDDSKTIREQLEEAEHLIGRSIERLQSSSSGEYNN